MLLDGSKSRKNSEVGGRPNRLHLARGCSGADFAPNETQKPVDAVTKLALVGIARFIPALVGAAESKQYPAQAAKLINPARKGWVGYAIGAEPFSGGEGFGVSSRGYTDS